MDRFKKAISTDTAKTSAIFYFGTFGTSVFRYFFHLILLRLLTPAQYGEFFSYLSLIYLLGIPNGTIGTLVVKTASDFFGKGDKESANAFFYYMLKLITPISFALAILLVIFSSPLAIVFKAHPAAFIVLSISMLISPMITMVGSYISALQKFVFQTISGVLGILIVTLLSIFLIKLGFGATGAIIGQLLSGVIVVIWSFYHIRKYVLPAVTKVKKFKIDLKSYTGFSLFLSIGTLSLVSTDVLVVRYLLNTTDSGLYSALSILGRMILFGLTPLVALVLPMASHRHSATGNANSIFRKLGFVMVAFGILGAGLFSLFPAFFIRVLSGSAYIAAAPLLPLFAFSMLFFALSQFVSSFLMAVGRPQATILLMVATVLQPVGFFVFGVTLSHVVTVNFFIHLSLLLSLLSYYYISRKAVYN